MQVSVDDPQAHLYRIFLDDELQGFVQRAYDADGIGIGWIDQIERDGDGKIVSAVSGEPNVIRRTGKVRIVQMRFPNGIESLSGPAAEERWRDFPEDVRAVVMAELDREYESEDITDAAQCARRILNAALR